MSPTKSSAAKHPRLQIKRIYDPVGDADGFRVLVDRLWPRGVAKEKAHIDLWLKDVAPSDALRKRFHGHPAKWDEFVAAYGKELAQEPAKSAEEEEEEEEELRPENCLINTSYGLIVFPGPARGYGQGLRSGATVS